MQDIKNSVASKALHDMIETRLAAKLKEKGILSENEDIKLLTLACVTLNLALPKTTGIFGGITLLLPFYKEIVENTDLEDKAEEVIEVLQEVGKELNVINSEGSFEVPYPIDPLPPDLRKSLGHLSVAKFEELVPTCCHCAYKILGINENGGMEVETNLTIHSADNKDLVKLKIRTSVEGVDIEPELIPVLSTLALQMKKSVNDSFDTILEKAGFINPLKKEKEEVEDALLRDLKIDKEMGN